MPTPPVIQMGQIEKLVRERILLYGDSDSGKTYLYLTIARYYQMRKAKGTFYGLCSPGNQWDKFFGPGGEFEGLENVVPFDVEEIQDYFDKFDKKIKPKATKDDWLCIDVISDVWGAAGDEYSKKENKGRDLGEAWATTGGDYPVEGWQWGRINARYRSFAQNRLLRFPGHLVGLAWDKDLQEAAKSSGKGGESDEVRDLFGLIGKKPAGQKEDYKRFDTIIHLGVNGRGEHVARTARDRQRDRLGDVIQRGTAQVFRGQPISNFFLEYLVKIAGWKP